MTINRNVSNEKAKRLLGWRPIVSQEQALLAAADTLIKAHLV
ncbi:hypothetical protein [Secundilactobacillus kimchicus]